MSDYREYENCVADVLAFVLGKQADVSRNVMLPVRGGTRERQVDVCARIQLGQLTQILLIVDCKLYGRPAHVGHVDSFVGMVSDVGAQVGILMTSSGHSSDARDRAAAARNVGVATLTLPQLRSWSPKGTVTRKMHVAPDDARQAAKKLRDIGFRVIAKEVDGDHGVLELLRHYGTTSPPTDAQDRDRTAAERALNKAGIQFEWTGHGITVGGGTPAHRMMQITLAGVPTGIKIMAANEEDVEEQLDRLAPDLALPRDRMDVDRPSGWPVPGLFGLEGLPIDLLRPDIDR